MPILVKKNASSFERSSGELLATLREKHPLVHHITNYVTVNDCANITLCIGASPVMAEAKEEVEEMVSMAGALVLNIGTLRKEQVEAMLIAGRRANEHSIPVILDPVGAGATSMRTNAARRLLEELDVAVIKGNAGEIGVLAGSGGVVRGVDSGGISGDPMIAASRLANATGSVVVMSGATDIITDGTDAILVDSGHPLMGAVSGTGCMASSLVGSFAAVADDLMISSAAALVAFGIAGERAARNAIGPASFKIALLDAVAAPQARGHEGGKGEGSERLRLDLYVVTDRKQAKGRSHHEVVEMALAGGADVIQLRDKDMDDRGLLALASDLRELTARMGALLIVNDRPDIALASNADGVHLGQDDMPVAAVRRILPPSMIVGASVGTVSEAVRAEEEGASYVALSPVFSTGSKDDAGPGRGLEMLSRMKDAVSIPVVAIGGIDGSNAASVIEAGADGIAVISAVVSQDDIEASARSLRQIVAEAKRRAGRS